MKFSNQRQHKNSVKAEIVFVESTNRWNELTLVAMFEGKEIKKFERVADKEIKKFKEQVLSQFKSLVAA